MQPYLTKFLIDEALVRRNGRMLWIAAGMMFAATVVGFVLNIISSYHYTRVSAQILFAMRLRCFEHLQRLSPRFYARTKLGDIVSRLNNDIGEIQRVSSDVILSLLSNLIFLVGSVAIMVLLNFKLFVVGVAMLPFSIWAVRHFQDRLAAHVQVLREKSAGIGTFLIESLMGLRLVVANAAEQRETERFRGHNQSFVDALLRMQMTSYLAGAIPATILTISTSAVFLYGGSLVIDAIFRWVRWSRSWLTIPD